MQTLKPQTHIFLPQVTDLYDPREQWASYLINALKAKELQARDTSYIVRGQEVIIVDEFTGRTMPGRRWGEGLHQARAPGPVVPFLGGSQDFKVFGDL